MGLDKFPRSVFEKDDNLSRTNFRKEVPPEGWFNTFALSKKIETTSTAVKNTAEKYRNSNPEWFKPYYIRGVAYEHYAPALVEIVEKELSARESAPEGWETRHALTKETGKNDATLAKMAEPYKLSHPEWFKNFIAANNREQEHYAPELVKVLLDKATAHEKAPEGWETIGGMATKFNFDYGAVKKIIDSLPQEDLPKTETYLDRGRRPAVHFSPEVVKQVQEKLESFENVPAGWKTFTSVAESLNKDAAGVKKRLDVYQSSHPEWLKTVKTSKGHFNIYAPELIQQVENYYSKLQTAPTGWLTRHEVGNLLDVSKPTVAKLVGEQIENHPEWGKTFLNERGQETLYYDPALMELLSKRNLSQVVREKVPSGWMNIRELAKTHQVYTRIIQDLVQEFLKDHDTAANIKKTKSKNGPHLTFFSPDIVAYVSSGIARKKEELPSKRQTAEDVPEGWTTVGTLAGKFQTNNKRVADIVDQYRSSNPNWFRLFKTRHGFGREYLSPELAVKIQERFTEGETAPAGWLTNGALAKEIERSATTIAKTAARFRDAHPEWFRKFLAANYAIREHYAPELIVEIRRSAEKEIAPEGWLPNSNLATELNIHANVIARFANSFRAVNPDWFKQYTAKNGGIVEHYSPQLTDLIRERLQSQRAHVETARELAERESKLQDESKMFIKDVSEGQTLEAQEFRRLITLFGPVHTADILYKYRPQFEGVSPDYIKGTLAKYLGDFLILNSGFRIKDLEVALPFLSNQTLKDSLFEVMKEGCLAHYHEQKLTHPETEDQIIISSYLKDIRRQIASFNSGEMNDVVNRVDGYYLSILQDFEKPNNVVDVLREGRPFPDLNQTLNIKEIKEKKKMLIGDEMGMGKSASAILSKEYLGSKCALVVVPSNVVETWQKYLSDEVSEAGEQVGYFKKGMAPRVLTVENPMFLKALDVSQYDYILISQEKLNKRYVKELESVNYDMLIIDEVHKLKNLQQGERSQYTLNLAEKVGDDKHLVLLSGTPVPNKIKDVAMVLKLLYPERFASKNVSDDELVDSIIRGDIVDMRNLLVPRMQMKALRESIKMPELTEELLTTTLTQQEQDIYEILLEDDELTADQKIRAFRKFVMNPSSLEVTPNIEGSKIRDVREHLQTVFRNKNKIVFFVNSYVEGMIRGENTILDKLNLPPEITVRVIEGEVSRERRSEIQRELDETEGKMLLAVSGGTADVGVDFSSADHVEMYNEPWTKFDKSQQIARVYRPGLENDLTVSTSRTEGTIEQGIGEYIELKYNAIQKLLKGVPITDIEQNLLRSAEKQRTPDIEGNVAIAAEWLNSPQNRLNRFLGVTKEIGEKNFHKFLLEHGEEYAESYLDMGSRGFQANTGRVVGTLINRFIAEKSSQENPKILDIASGPEMLKAHIDDSHKENVVSLDINPAHFQNEGTNRVVGSFVNLPIADKSIDYANLSLALHYTRFVPKRKDFERLQVLSEMNRVLNEGGRAVINLLYSLRFKDQEKFKNVVEAAGFRVVPEYTGTASSSRIYESPCIVLEKVRDVNPDFNGFLEEVGRENLDGIKFKETGVHSLKNSRRIVTEFRINDESLPVSFNAEDRQLYEEEQSILREGEALREQYGSIREIPKEEIINRNFLKIYNGKSYRLLKKSEKIGGFVDVR